MCMNICGMDSVIVVDSMDEMFIRGGVLAEFEHHEPLSLPVGVQARTHKYYTPSRWHWLNAVAITQHQ